MTRLIRTLLGVTVAVALIPAVNWTIGADEDRTSASQGQLARMARTASPEAQPDSDPGRSESASGANDGRQNDLTAVDSNNEPSLSLPDAPSSAEASSTDTSDASNRSSGQPTTTSAAHADHQETTSSNSGHDDSDSDETIASGSISGDACPCTITGTVELKGNVNLQGDLMVMGGTLIARAGVDLNGNGHQIMFMQGGRADFRGTPTSTWSGDGSNANLTRDINFTNLRRILFHEGARPSVLKYFRISDSGTAGVLGDYPLHWHLNGGSSRGTLVEGVVVLNGRNHAFVPHGSHGITIRDSIAKNTRDTPFWWDLPGTNNCSDRSRRSCTTDNSNDTTWHHNLVDGVTGGDGFLLNAGSGNVATGNVARNIGSSSGCAGFAWTEHSNYNDGGTVWVFKGNKTIDNDCLGIQVWQNDGSIHLIENFTSNRAISHGAYVNLYRYRNVEVPSLLVHALGWSISDSDVGDVVVRRHVVGSERSVTFTNVVLDSFTIDNAHNDGENPGTYVFSGSNLTCDEVIYKTVISGTRVIIDGQQCP